MRESNIPYVSVVIPIYNEYEGIPYLTDNLNQFFGEHPQLAAEVIFVNDGSKDGSVTRLKEMVHQNYRRSTGRIEMVPRL